MCRYVLLRLEQSQLGAVADVGDVEGRGGGEGLCVKNVGLDSESFVPSSGINYTTFSRYTYTDNKIYILFYYFFFCENKK